MPKQTVLNNDASATEWPTLHVPITDIYFNPEKNSRRVKSSPEEIEKLAADIRDNKQLFPLLVIPRGENGTAEGSANGGYLYEGIDGERRYNALKLLGDDATAFIRVLPSMDDAAAYLTSMKANDPTLRKEPSLIDLADNINKLKAHGKTGNEIAAQMGRSKGWVSDTANLTSLRPHIQKRIADRTLPFSLVRLFHKMEEADQDASIAELDAAASGSGTAAVVKDAKKRATKKKSAGKTRGKGKKSAKGDKASMNARPGMSAKAAIKRFEALAAAPVVDEETGKTPRESKAEETRRGVFGMFAKFLLGRMKEKALVEKLGELL